MRWCLNFERVPHKIYLLFVNVDYLIWWPLFQAYTHIHYLRRVISFDDNDSNTNIGRIHLKEYF